MPESSFPEESVQGMDVIARRTIASREFPSHSETLFIPFDIDMNAIASRTY